jgi:hypothetical protein
MLINVMDITYVYFTAIWYILWSFGMYILWPFVIFCGYFGIIFPFWYAVPRKIWQPWFSHLKMENKNHKSLFFDEGCNARSRAEGGVAGRGRGARQPGAGKKETGETKIMSLAFWFSEHVKTDGHEETKK